MFTKTIEEVAKAVNSGELLLTIQGDDVHTSEIKEDEGCKTWSVLTKGEGFPSYEFDMEAEVTVGEDADDIAYATDLETGNRVIMSLVTKAYKPWNGE